MKKRCLVLPASFLLLFGGATVAHADMVGNGSSNIAASFVAQGLTLDQVPTFDFGSHAVSGLAGSILDASAEDLGTGPQASEAQVTDLRGTDAGWSLSVTQQAQFSTTSTGGDTFTLVGALVNFNTITISNLSGSPLATNTSTQTGAIVLSENSSLAIDTPTLVFQAPADPTNGSGTGTNVITFGKLGTLSSVDSTDTVNNSRVVNPDVQLSIPTDVGAVLAQKYTATFVWSLQDSPNDIV